MGDSREVMGDSILAEKPGCEVIKEPGIQEGGTREARDN